MSENKWEKLKDFLKWGLIKYRFAENEYDRGILGTYEDVWDEMTKLEKECDSKETKSETEK